MEENYLEENVRTRLILAGIRELEEHGSNDFSLRRVALAAEVSCAAPYRHFKSREELIFEILRYIREKWDLLCIEIENAFPDTIRRLEELCIAYIRFWIANPNFRSILFITSTSQGDSMGFETSIIKLINKISKDRKQGDEFVDEMKISILTCVYGTVMLIIRGELENNSANLNRVAQRIRKEIEAN